jgi:hypothetical protein
MKRKLGISIMPGLSVTEAERLRIVRAAGFDGPLTLELSMGGLPGYHDYSAMTVEAFINEAYRRAERLRTLCENARGDIRQKIRVKGVHVK